MDLSLPLHLKEEFSLYQKLWDTVDYGEKVNKSDTHFHFFRFVGQPDSYKFDSLNFYDGEYFMGAEQFFYTDAPQMNLDNFGR